MQTCTVGVLDARVRRSRSRQAVAEVDASDRWSYHQAPWRIASCVPCASAWHAVMDQRVKCQVCQAEVERPAQVLSGIELTAPARTVLTCGRVACIAVARAGKAGQDLAEVLLHGR